MNVCDDGVGGGLRRKGRPLRGSEWPSSVAWECHEATEVAGLEPTHCVPQGTWERITQVYPGLGGRAR